MRNNPHAPVLNQITHVQNVNVSEQLVTYKKEVKALKQKVCQRNKRIQSMEELIYSLKKKS